MEGQSGVPPAAFLSYAHADDENDDGLITAFRARLQKELCAQTGRRDLRIFLDKDMDWGEAWRARIDRELDAVTFFVPIVTPAFLASEQCRRELARFLERERRLGRHDLILPVYWISVLQLEMEGRAHDELAVALKSRHYADWRKLRFHPLADPECRRTMADLACRVRDALERVEPNARRGSDPSLAYLTGLPVSLPRQPVAPPPNRPLAISAGDAGVDDVRPALPPSAETVTPVHGGSSMLLEPTTPDLGTTDPGTSDRWNSGTGTADAETAVAAGSGTGTTTNAAAGNAAPSAVSAPGLSDDPQPTPTNAATVSELPGDGATSEARPTQVGSGSAERADGRPRRAAATSAPTFVAPIGPTPPDRVRGWARVAAAWRRRWVKAAAVLIPVLLLLTLVIVLLPRPTEPAAAGTPCDSPFLSVRGTECIGLRKDAGPFTTAPGGGSREDRQVTEIWGMIVGENHRVEASGQRYRTVVVAAALSSSEPTPVLDTKGLFGVFTALRRWNDQAAAMGAPWLRVWLVNIGGNSSYVASAAEILVRNLSGSDDVVAVTGLGQTRDETLSAIGTIGGGFDGHPGFPMVAATQSGDILTGQKNYFRIAANDKRQAAVGARWVPAGGYTGVVPYLVYQKGDPWSEGLYRNYRDESAAEGVRWEDWDDEETGRIISYLPSSDSSSGDTVLGGDMSKVEARICGDPPRNERGEPLPDAPRTVIFTGRADYVHTLLRELNATSCAKSIRVLGGDALTSVQYPTLWPDVRDQLRAGGAHLVYTAFGADSRDGVVELHGETIPSWNDFAEWYRQLNGELSEDLRLPEHPESAVQAQYDAVTLVATAVDRAYRGIGSGELPDRTQVYEALRLTTGANKYQGVTGTVDFGPPPETPDGSGADPRDKLVVLHRMTVGENGEPDAQYVCAAAGFRDGTDPNTCRP